MGGIIDPSLMKWYHPLETAEGSTHGGGIDTTNEIVSGLDNNIFDDVSDAERESGDIEFRKVYIRNENVATYKGMKCWIQSNTPASNTNIGIALGTDNDVQTDAEGYTFVEPTSKVDINVLDIGDVVQNAAQAIWIKRTVTAGGLGYTDDGFTIRIENS